jgi:DNA-binding SARP family transcriptional activator/tetratricopeptide (TPR) repeat protein
LATLRIELFGGVRAREGDGREVRITGRKCQALLGCLALRPGMACTREFLAAMLWEDAEGDLARSSLRQALARLRRELPQRCAGVLCADTQSVWLDADRVTSDVAELRAQLHDAAPDVLLATIDRCGEDLLAGIDVRSVSFEHWVQEQRRSLHRQLVDALARTATRCAAASDLAGQQGALERLVQLEPVNESAHRDLMGVLVRRGRHTDALRQFRQCRDALRRDLDVAVEPATDALRREILRLRRGTEQPLAPPQAQAQAQPQATAAAMALPAASLRAPLLREVVVLCVRDVSTLATPDATDPERISQRWSEFEARVRAVAGQFGGCVDRIGTGEMLAVFGLDSMAGNEAARAVRTAWTLTTKAGAVHAADGAAFACGIAAGQVLPAGVAEPFPLTGRPIGEARELARAAPHGSTCLSPDVAGRLPPDAEHEPAIAARQGGPRRLVAWSRRGAIAAPDLFVGRRAEMALLLALLREVTHSRRARSVVIRGEPGIGKSAVARRLTQDATLQGIESCTLQALDFGQAAAERPIPALALLLLGAGSDLSLEARAEVVTRAAAEGRIAPDEVLLASDLIGARISDEGRSRLAAMDKHSRELGRAGLLQRLLQRAASSQPLLLVIEDAHWLSAEEIARLADVAASVAALPVLFCLTSRPVDDALATAWSARGRGCPLTTLELALLADDEARELAASQADLPAEAIERCLAAALGHPLFLEQLLRAARAGQTALPGDVRGLVLARIERLAPDMQHALHAAAVLGIRFSADALRHVLADHACSVDALEHTGLIAVERDECRFAHALIRDAVYESLLGSARRAFHRRAASWYDGRDCGLLAEHLAAADDAGAAAAFVRASAENLHAYRLDRALLYAERAVEYGRDPPASSDAHAALGDVHLAAGRTGEANTAFRRGFDVATTRAARARALFGLAMSLRIVDRYDEALATLAQAESELEPGDSHRQASLWTLRGNLHFPRGELEQCLAAHLRALEFAKQAGSVEGIARARGGLGDAHYQRGRLRSAHAEFHDCVALSERHGLKGLQVAYLPMLAVTRTYTGSLEVALATAVHAVEVAREVGDRRAQVLALLSHASIELYRARYSESTASIELGRALASDLGARRFETELCVLSGLVQIALRDDAGAQGTLEQAARNAREVCPTYCGPWALAALALSLRDRGRVRALLGEGEDLLARGCVSHNYFEFYLLGIEVALRFKDTSLALRYAAELEAYTRDEPLPWADVVIRRGRALVAALQANPGAAASLRLAQEAAHSIQWHSMEPALARAIAARGQT